MFASFAIGAPGAPVGASPAAKGRAEADFPVTFAGTAGLYSAPRGNGPPADSAVLFVSSWGFEELCARKFWRLLADELAQQGMASLRFDYPGTGDALDPADEAAGLELWIDSILSAAATLRDISGVRRLLLIGHGLGGALAWKAAERLQDVAGLAMAAPVLSGRHWVREFVALSRIANQGGLQHTLPATGPTMGEQTIPEPVLAGIRGINIAASGAVPAPDILLLAQNTRPDAAGFAQQLAGQGVEAQCLPFEGYDRFTRDVLFSVPPRAAIATLAQWAVRLARPSAADLPASVPAPLPLTGDGFIETPVRFGEGNRLYGILSEPQGPRRGATVLVLPTGYERMSGWGRITVRVCRALARAGIPALRFDFGNVADSPPQPGAPEQINYNDCQVRDVEAALTFLEARKLLPVAVTGRCSGGYTAFRSAAVDSRISAAVAVNVFDFHVPPDTDIEKMLMASLQPLSSYGAKMRSGGFWKRVLRGEVNVARGVRSLSTMLVARGVSLSLPLLVRFPFLSRKFRLVTGDFRAIEARGTQLSVLYTEGDVGVPYLETTFGPRGYLLSRYANTSLRFIADADHNLTTAPAREVWEEELRKVALKLPPQT